MCHYSMHQTSDAYDNAYCKTSGLTALTLSSVVSKMVLVLRDVMLSTYPGFCHTSALISLELLTLLRLVIFWFCELSSMQRFRVSQQYFSCCSHWVLLLNLLTVIVAVWYRRMFFCLCVITVYMQLQSGCVYVQCYWDTERLIKLQDVHVITMLYKSKILDTFLPWKLESRLTWCAVNEEV